MRRIIKWFKFVFNIQSELDKRDKQIADLSYEIQRNHDFINKHQKQIAVLQSLVDVGVDVHQYTKSWAVICLKGKTDYIKFYQFDNNQIIAIRDFLKQFEKSNIVIDAPYHLPKKYFL